VLHMVHTDCEALPSNCARSNCRSGVSIGLV
jgi:hypothetical protein